MKSLVLISIGLLFSLSYSQKPNQTHFTNSLGMYNRPDSLKPLYFDVTTIDGKEIDTKNLTDKIIVLNFWFIACTPCRWELKQLAELANKYHNDSDVLFISISSMDGPEQLKYVTKRTGFSYQLVASRSDICSAFKVNLYPTNIVIQNGKILKEVVGYHQNINQIFSKFIDSVKNVKMYQ